ncbi:unnamed protein product [Lepidochelys kempii]
MSFDLLCVWNPVHVNEHKFRMSEELGIKYKNEGSKLTSILINMFYNYKMTTMKMYQNIGPCDGAEWPRTVTARVKPSFLAEEAPPWKPCWACSNWRIGIKARKGAKSGLTTGREVGILPAPEEGQQMVQGPAKKGCTWHPRQRSRQEGMDRRTSCPRVKNTTVKDI